MISLKDVANACGVSIATVSKALNDQSDISAERKAQINEKAREMGYLPNLAARALKTNVTHDIGVLFADEHNSGLTHPYFSQVLEGVKQGAESSGYDITFINKNLGTMEMSFLEHCRYRNVDGVIIACIEFDRPEVAELLGSGIPVVTIDHVFSNCACIVSDNIQGIKDLLEYVIGMGHRRIAFIHGKPSAVTNDRLASFYRTMEEHGLDVPEEYTAEINYLDDVEAAEATRKMLSLKKRPTCILYPDDVTGVGGMNAIRSMGLSVPEDISVTGYDGVPLSQIVSPHLTTLEQDMNRLGKEAAFKMVELIEKPKTAIKGIITVKGRVIKGESVSEIKVPG